MSLRKEVRNIRNDYDKFALDESEVLKDPVLQFEQWFEAAVKAEVSEPNAMALGTSYEGQPSVRIVLLKGFDERGFVYYTNYGSRKAREIQANPQAALTFFWHELHRQVRIEGRIEKVSAEESDDYYASRDRGSRIGAWASPQSQPISSRDELEAWVRETEARFEGLETIPRPEHWGGYRVIPNYVEFWQGRKSRLHDRIVYRLEEGGWTMERIAP